MLISWNKHKMYNGIKLILTSVPLLYVNNTSFYVEQEKRLEIFSRVNEGLMRCFWCRIRGGDF